MISWRLVRISDSYKFNFYSKEAKPKVYFLRTRISTIKIYTHKRNSVHSVFHNDPDLVTGVNVLREGVINYDISTIFMNQFHSFMFITQCVLIEHDRIVVDHVFYVNEPINNLLHQLM